MHQINLNTPAIRNLDIEAVGESDRLRIEAEAIRPIVRLPIFPILSALYDGAPRAVQAEAWRAASITDDRLSVALLRYIGGETWAKAKLRAAVEALPA